MHLRQIVRVCESAERVEVLGACRSSPLTSSPIISGSHLRVSAHHSLPFSRLAHQLPHTTLTATHSAERTALWATRHCYKGNRRPSPLQAPGSPHLHSSFAPAHHHRALAPAADPQQPWADARSKYSLSLYVHLHAVRTLLAGACTPSRVLLEHFHVEPAKPKPICPFKRLLFLSSDLTCSSHNSTSATGRSPSSR